MGREGTVPDGEAEQELSYLIEAIFLLSVPAWGALSQQK